MVSVLFVCLGNICRSPAAETVLRHKAKELGIDDIHTSSCGIGDWHVGQLADPRMIEAASQRGFNIEKKAAVFEPHFFDQYDYILASGQDVLKELHKKAKTAEHKSKVLLITAFSPSYANQEVPDPYFSGYGAFDLVLNIIEDSCEGLLEEIKKRKTA